MGKRQANLPLLVKRAREKLNLSQEGLARKIGVSFLTVILKYFGHRNQFQWLIGSERSSLQKNSLIGKFILLTLEGSSYCMRIISKKVLVEYWKKVPAAESELKAWHAEAKAAEWNTPADVKAKYGNASILKDGRVVFNICGNKYSLKNSPDCAKSGLSYFL